MLNSAAISKYTITTSIISHDTKKELSTLSGLRDMAATAARCVAPPLGGPSASSAWNSRERDKP
ncbi:MAG: hypothetical protein JJ964_02015 [Rhizobiales bacterium]|nr:hypothetical protein [Hyphomicrobiales bacterium]